MIKQMLGLAQVQSDREAAKVNAEAGILQELYTAYDRKAGTYLPPFVAVNDVVAARLMLASSMNGDSMLQAFPDDFDLYHLGSLAQRTGHLIQTEIRWVASFSSILQAAAQSAPKPSSSTADQSV